MDDRRDRENESSAGSSEGVGVEAPEERVAGPEGPFEETARSEAPSEPEEPEGRGDGGEETGSAGPTRGGGVDSEFAADGERHDRDVLQEDRSRRNPEFSVGLDVFIEIPKVFVRGKTLRCRTAIRGWYPGEFFITDPLRVEGHGLDFGPSGVHTIRFVLDGMVYGFRSTLIGRTVKPKNLFFWEYPRFVESLSLRQTRRFQVMLPVRVEQAEGDSFDAVLLDVSKGGARLRGEVRLRPGAGLRLDFTLPDGRHVRGLEAMVRNELADRDSVDMGVEFTAEGESRRFVETFLEKLAALQKVSEK